MTADLDALRRELSRAASFKADVCRCGDAPERFNVFVSDGEIQVVVIDASSMREAVDRAIVEYRVKVGKRFKMETERHLRKAV